MLRPFAYVACLVAVSACLDVPPSSHPSPNVSPPVDVDREAVRFTTDMGPFTVLLYPEAAPKTVDLVKQYVHEGYYKGREFNRVVPGHVIQITDKEGGATDDARRVPLEPDPLYHFSAGAAGVARGSDPNSGGPELFFMDFATSHLDGNFTVWGQVLDGLDTVHKVARVPTVDLTKVPGASNYLTDRQAINAPVINDVALVTVRVPGVVNAGLPLVVAKNVATKPWRHSLEWPRNLAAGQASSLTWYIRSSDDNAPPPAAADVRIRVGDRTMAVQGEPAAAGVYHWSWTPPAWDAYAATLVVQGRDNATLRLPVTGPSP